jgi:hypothetical protein
LNQGATEFKIKVKITAISKDVLKKICYDVSEVSTASLFRATEFV